MTVGKIFQIGFFLYRESTDFGKPENVIPCLLCPPLSLPGSGCQSYLRAGSRLSGVSLPGRVPLLGRSSNLASLAVCRMAGRALRQPVGVLHWLRG